MQEKFIEECSNGNFDEVVKIYNNCVSKSHIRLLLKVKQKAFDIAYTNRHYAIAMWIYKLQNKPQINIHHDNEKLLIDACEEEIFCEEHVKWLWDLYLEEEQCEKNIFYIGNFNFEMLYSRENAQSYKKIWEFFKKNGKYIDCLDLHLNAKWPINDFKWYYKKVIEITEKEPNTYNKIKQILIEILRTICFEYINTSDKEQHLQKIKYCYVITKNIMKRIGDIEILPNVKTLFYLFNDFITNKNIEEIHKEPLFFVVEWFFDTAIKENNPIDFSDNNYTFFSNFCHGHDIQTIKYLFEVYKKCETTNFTKIFNNENLIAIGCATEPVTWFNETAKNYGIILNLNYNDDFLFRRGNINMCKYLIENSNVNINAYCNEIYELACYIKDVDLILYIYNLSLENEKNEKGQRINLHRLYKNSDFENMNISYEVIKCVYNLSIEEEESGIGTRLDIHFLDDVFFANTYWWKFENIKWFYELSLEEEEKKIGKKINVCAHNNNFLRKLMYTGYNIRERQIILDWFFIIVKENNYPLDIHFDNEAIFRSYCALNELEMAKHIYDQSVVDELLGIGKRINIHAESDYAFKKSCKYYYKTIAEWLCTICDSYAIIEQPNPRKNFSNPIMIPKIYNSMTQKMLDIQNILKKKHKKDLLKIYDDAKVIVTESIDENNEDFMICPICMSSDDLDFKKTKLWIQLDCSEKHIICLHCFQLIDKCPYKCKPFFDLYNCKFIKQIQN